MDFLNAEIIFNVWLAMFVYNVLFKAFGATLLSSVMKGKLGNEARRAFKERLDELDKQK